MRSWLWLSTLLLMCFHMTAYASVHRQAVALNDKAKSALQTLFAQSTAARQLADNAKGILVFPEIVKAGFGLGGECGQGALLIQGKPVAHYESVTRSYGLQLGRQLKSTVFMFMSHEALREFRHSQRWLINNTDNKVILPSMAGTDSPAHPFKHAKVVGFVFSDRGLQYNFSLAGTAIKPLPAPTN